MRRWFLSYHSPDQALAERLKAAIERKDSTTRVFFAPTNLRAGGSWSVQLAQEIADANAFILLVGEAGVGQWQVPEYDEALDRWVKSPADFPLIIVLLEGQSVPGLPFCPAPAFRHQRRSGVGEGCRAAVRRGLRRRHAPRRIMALHLALSRPRSDGGKGQRLFFRPQDRDCRGALRACRRARPTASADRQFRRRQIFAGEGRRACSAQAPGLARGLPRAQCVAVGFPGQ